MDVLDSDANRIGLFIGAVALAIAVITALINARQAKRAAQANELYAYLEVRGRYHEEKMREHIVLLSNFGWATKRSQNHHWDALLEADRFGDIGRLLLPALDSLDEEARVNLLQAVRHVSSYFEDVGFLVKFEHIKRNCARSFIYAGGLNVYYEVCVPLYVARNADAVTLDFAKALRRVQRKHGQGLRVY